MYLRYDDIVEQLRKAVEVRGADFIYPKEWMDDRGLCRYAIDGQAACIVGQVIHQLGFDVARLVGFYGPPEAAIEWASGSGVVVEEGALRLLSEAQNNQDIQHPWGKAVRLAIEATC